MTRDNMMDRAPSIPIAPNAEGWPTRPPIASGPSKVPMPLKVVIAGGSGAGTTTLVGSISEIEPLRSQPSVGMDFGRVTLGDNDLTLLLFGIPGHQRFQFVWDGLSRGAMGAVLLVETERFADSFALVDYFEERRLPFVVAINCFNGPPTFPVDEIRSALSLDHDVPIVLTEAQSRDRTRQVLLRLVQHALARAQASTPSVQMV